MFAFKMFTDRNEANEEKCERRKEQLCDCERFIVLKLRKNLRINERHLCIYIHT